MLRLLIGLLLMSFISLQSASWQEPLRVSIEFVDLPKKIIRFPAHDLQVGSLVLSLLNFQIMKSLILKWSLLPLKMVLQRLNSERLSL